MSVESTADRLVAAAKLLPFVGGYIDRDKVRTLWSIRNATIDEFLIALRAYEAEAEAREGSDSMKRIVKQFHSFEGMCWPVATEDRDNSVEWVLRYGSAEDLEDVRMIAASYVSAYCALVYKVQWERNRICSKLQKLEGRSRKGATA